MLGSLGSKDLMSMIALRGAPGFAARGKGGNETAQDSLVAGPSTGLKAELKPNATDTMPRCSTTVLLLRHACKTRSRSGCALSELKAFVEARSSFIFAYSGRADLWAALPECPWGSDLAQSPQQLLGIMPPYMYQRPVVMTSHVRATLLIYMNGEICSI